ncbi:hypothetical protein LTS18_004902 [Coniosporium uncinatum]|uniref:Uncharacterized protein n=1 Tax=Coniosporium uncinatum TaxID=93489 RepID=A0ACC3DBB9_9PEZI|nr:hypothetical protein LTS18_004902 [Coniosporium uncinatum]
MKKYLQLQRGLYAPLHNTLERVLVDANIMLPQGDTIPTLIRPEIPVEVETPPVSDDLADFNSRFEDEGGSDNGPDGHRRTDNENQTTKLMDEPQRQPEAERLRGATPGREIGPAVEASTPGNLPSDPVQHGSPSTQERLEQWLTERVDRTREEILNALNVLTGPAKRY